MLGLAMFLAGLFAAKVGTRVSEGLVLCSILLCVVGMVRLRAILIPVVLLMGFVLGCLRGQIVMRQVAPLYAMNGKRVVIRGEAVTDGVYDAKTQLSFEASNLNFQKPIRTQTPGKIKVAGFGTTAIYRGDNVSIEGKLFVTRGSNQASVQYADLQVVSRNIGTLDRLRLNFVAGVESALPEPLASFGLGLLIGQRSTLPPAIASQLSVVGLTHIIAVSGYNLTIIVLAVMRLMRRRSKYQTMVVTLALIGIFLLLTGLSASIVRAAVVSILSLWAWYYGRHFRPVLLLLLAAAITAGWKPFYLWGDIGWYLSFSAFFGILVLAPLVKLRFFGQRNVKVLGAVVLETVCAQIVATPIILFVFKQVSIIALLGNILVVPFVPLAMLLVLVAGLAGMLMSAVAGWFAWPAKLLLTYMLDVVAVLARVPHAMVERSLSVIGLVTIYSAIAAWCIVLWHKTRSKYARITDGTTVFGEL